MTISDTQVAAVAADIDAKTLPVGRRVPKVSNLSPDALYFVFTNITVPAYRVMSIKKNASSGIYQTGEAVVVLQGVNGNDNYELGTGDQYDELAQRMFK